MTGLASHQQCRGCPQVACLPSRGPFLPGRPLVTVKQLFLLLLLICYGLIPPSIYPFSPSIGCTPAASSCEGWHQGGLRDGQKGWGWGGYRSVGHPAGGHSEEVIFEKMRMKTRFRLTSSAWIRFQGV